MIQKIVFVTIAILLIKPLASTAQYVYQNESVQKYLDEARKHVYYEQFADAVTKYASLVKSNDNRTVSAEYAYALALSGCYDGAIMNLDKVFASGQVDNEVLFYTSQVLRLMEYDSIADLFWTYSIEKGYIAPSWISVKYQALREKYKYLASINTDDLGTALQRANKLAERKQYIQSLVLFLELIETYPDQYLPCIGLSALLENLGFKTAAIGYLQKGIKKMGKDKFKIDPYGTYDKHLEKLKSENDCNNLSLQAEKTKTSKGHKSFMYCGVSYVNKAFSYNAKYGIYWRDNSYISFGFGIYSYERNNSYLADVAFCISKIIVLGLDVSLQWSGGQFSVGAGPCLGFSIPLGRTSIDILGVFNMYKQDDISASLSTSVGITHYF